MTDDAQGPLSASGDVLQNVVFVDTETTGLDPDTERIFELAIITADGTEYEFHLEPEEGVLWKMHPKALEVNRYFERTKNWAWVKDVPHVLDHDVRRLLEGKHIVGAVPDFDARHLTATYKRNGLEPPRWHYHLIDVETLVVGFLSAKGVSLSLPWDSDELSEAIGIKPDTSRHEALYDAQWAKSQWEAVMT